jgi:hypothetical protein
MGVSTQGKLNNSISIVDIENVIKKYYDYQETYQYGDSSYQIYFLDGNAHRNLHIYIGFNYSTETEISKWLSLGCWGNSKEIMKTICSYFGGWLDENDCDDKDYYWIEQTNNFDDNIKTEIYWVNFVNSKLNSVFTYEETKKILNNEKLIREVFGSN